MYAFFLKHVSLPLYELRRGRGMLKRVAGFEKSQWLAPEQLQAMQFEKLKKLLKHAYEQVPLYREKFDVIGAEPEDI